MLSLFALEFCFIFCSLSLSLSLSSFCMYIYVYEYMHACEWYNISKNCMIYYENSTLTLTTRATSKYERARARTHK